MKLWCFALALGAGALMASANAAAADISTPYLRSFDPLPAYGGSSPQGWGGAYAGGHIGYGWGTSANSWAPTPLGPWLPDGDIDYPGLTAGLHAGYQAQFNSLVIGAEADISLGALKGNDAQFAGFVNEIEIDTIGTLRGRLGFAHDNFMIFATGGVAGAGFNKRDITNQFSGHNFATGWVLGAGVEIALTDNLRARAEYQYIALDPVETGVVAATGGGYMHRADTPSISIIRGGLSYAF